MALGSFLFLKEQIKDIIIIRVCLEDLALMILKRRMVLANPGPLLTSPPSSSPPKTPHQSYSAQIRSQNAEKKRGG